MLYKGNERMGPIDIGQWFDGIGAWANAFTDREATGLSVRMMPRHVERTFDVLAEMAVRPAFDGKELNRERQVVLEEIAMYEDSPASVAFECAEQRVFAAHSLGRPILGTAQHISSVTPEELRAFHEEHYSRARVSIAVAGNVDHDELRGIIERKFASAFSGSADANRLPGRIVPTSDSGSICIVEKESEQANVVVAAPGVPITSDDRYAAMVLDTILGAGYSSRLFLQVRELRGLAYSVGSFTSPYSDAGMVGMTLGTRPDRLGEALEIATREIDRMCVEAPSQEEIDRAIESIDGQLSLSLENPETREARIGSRLALDLPYVPVDYVRERIRLITAVDVLDVASRLFPAERRTIVVAAEDVESAKAAIAQSVDGTIDVITEHSHAEYA
jgi:predicted Zn-dependent peptidase